MQLQLSLCAMWNFAQQGAVNTAKKGSAEGGQRGPLCKYLPQASYQVNPARLNDM